MKRLDKPRDFGPKKNISINEISRNIALKTFAMDQASSVRADF
jgi:hypothetical protein